VIRYVSGLLKSNVYVSGGQPPAYMDLPANPDWSETGICASFLLDEDITKSCTSEESLPNNDADEWEKRFSSAEDTVFNA